MIFKCPFTGDKIDISKIDILDEFKKVPELPIFKGPICNLNYFLCPLRNKCKLDRR